MRTVTVRNTSGAERTFVDVTLQDGYSYTLLSKQELQLWSSNNSLLKDITDGYATINNGSADLSSISDAIDWLKGIDSKYNPDGHLMVEVEPKVGSRKTITTHNFCDPCSWSEGSTRVDGGDGYGQELVTIDAYTTYRSPDGYVNWIDMGHGRMSGEDLKIGYDVELTVDGNPKVEDLDYTVNYEDGYVIFNTPLTSSNQVKASFSYESGSIFTIGPSAGKKLRILYTEVQFSKKATINYKNPVRFQVWVYNPYDFPNKVPYGTPEIYKGVKDLMNIGTSGIYLPQFGDMQEDVVIIPFQYAAVTDLPSSAGAEIRVTLDNDVPIDGYYGTMTAYCLSEDE